MAVTASDLRAAIRALDLAGMPVCIHSSLRSLGRVEGGAEAVVEAFLTEGCTVLVPTASYESFAEPPPQDQRPARNGWDYAAGRGPAAPTDRVFTPASTALDRDMGSIPAHVVRRPDRWRGDHPLSSFSAVGPLARRLVAGQSPENNDAPLEALAKEGGAVLLIGVGLTRMTLLHVAEHRAGREPFRRWANGRDGRPRMVRAGSCSEGFERLAPALAGLRRDAMVGSSRWQVYPAAETLAAATAAIRADPAITHCGDPDCERCRDGVLGGPIMGDED